MFKLHTKDGVTATVDLADEAQAREWLPRLARSEASITGVTLVTAHGYSASIVKPIGFDQWEHRLESVQPSGRNRGGERVVVLAGDIQLTVMAHADSPAVRIAVSRRKCP